MPQTYGLSIDVQSTSEPLTLQEVKDHLRVTLSDEDGLITRLLRTALEYVQDATNKQLVETTYTYRRDTFPRGSRELKLPVGPVSEVLEVRYIDLAGNEQTMDEADYHASLDREPASVVPAYNEVWPAARRQRDAVAVQFTAGYGDPSDVPDRFKEAMLLLIGHWYEYRQEVVEGAIPTTIPKGVDALLAQLSYDDEFDDL